MNTSDAFEMVGDFRVAHPETDVQFVGFGGSTIEFETMVFYVNGEEVRIPQWPEVFPVGEVSREYGCLAALSLDEALENITEALEDIVDR